MKELAIRLHRGMDLKLEIENFVILHQIKSGVVVCGVGCLTQAVMRAADGVRVFESHKNYEIVSLQGTLGLDGCHLHIALSDESLITIGGHLLHGCLVNTTVELVVLSFDEMVFHRDYEEKTGYKELVIIPTKPQDNVK